MKGQSDCLKYEHNIYLLVPCFSRTPPINQFLCQVIGEEVQRCKPERFTLILLKVRQMLISHTPELSVKSKCVLLHILELHLLRWPTLLPEKTGEWYSEIIGQRVLMRRPDLAAQNQTSIKLNGHDQLKEVLNHSY